MKDSLFNRVLAFFNLDPESTEQELEQHLTDQMEEAADTPQTATETEEVTEEQEAQEEQVAESAEQQERVQKLEEEVSRLTAANEQLNAALEKLDARMAAYEQAPAEDHTGGQSEPGASAEPVWMRDPINQRGRRRK